MIDDRTFAANLTNEGGVGGTFRLLRNVTGLWLLHECRRAWALEGHEYGFDELVALAEDAPPLRSLIDPDDARFAAPGDMPRRIREFCAETGQDEPTEPAAVVRCILESLALGHARVVELLDEVTGADPEEIHVVGGGAQNELLCQWTADAAGLPVLAGPVGGGRDRQPRRAGDRAGRARLARRGARARPRVVRAGRLRARRAPRVGRGLGALPAARRFAEVAQEVGS